MADSKLTGLSNQVVASTDDLLFVLDAPATSAGYFKCTVAAFFNTPATSSIPSISGLALGAATPVANQIVGAGAITIVPAAGSNFAGIVSGAGTFQISTNQIAYDPVSGNFSIGDVVSASYRYQAVYNSTNHRKKISNSQAANVANECVEEYHFKNAAGTETKFGEIACGCPTVTTGAEVGDYEIRVLDAGVMATPMRIVGTIAVFGDQTSTPAANLNARASSTSGIAFRVESSNGANTPPGCDYMNGYVTTTDATVATLLLIPMVASSTYLLQVRAKARRTGGVAGAADDAGVYLRRGAFKVSSAGVVTAIGAATMVFSHEDQVGWNLHFSISGSNVQVRATGAADNNISWGCTAEIYRMA